MIIVLFQSYYEGVRWGTPYSLVILRSSIPILGLIAFFTIAIIQHKRVYEKDYRKNIAVQIAFLSIVLILSYWAATAPLRPNWFLLIGGWITLPLLYLGRTKIINPNTLLSLGSIVLTLVLIEILLRPFPQIWPGYSRMVGSNWRRIHADIPTLLYEKDGIHYQINELGFRGLAPVPDRAGIVTLGDSATFGVGSEIPWPDRLSQLLDEPVLNLGMGGTDPPKHIGPLIAFGLPREPRLVIEMYFEGNDLFTCYQPAKPQGPRWGDRHVLPDVIGGWIEVARRWSRGPVITSELSYDIATPLTRVIAGNEITLTFSPAYSATLTLDANRLLASENWRIASNSLLRMRDLAYQNDATFVLVYLPERTHVYWPIIRDDDKILETLNKDMIYQWNSSLGCLLIQRGRMMEDLNTFREGLDRTIDIQREIVGSFAAENGIPFLDLTGPLQELAAAGQTMADPLETHFNDAVNQFIAECITIFLHELQDS
ncbi:MAG: hypothetical protein KAI06_08805 [Anaerolineales bacterium]|nr:hypothetical protein [Anaerolineales bacterium]